MKRCPTCNKTFTDQNLSFCIDDGTPLWKLQMEPMKPQLSRRTAPQGNANAETEAYVPRDWQQEYQPPGSFAPPGRNAEFGPGSWESAARFCSVWLVWGSLSR